MTMQVRLLKIGCVLMALLLCIGMFAGCSIGAQEEESEPVAVTLKTDLHDASFESWTRNRSPTCLKATKTRPTT